MEYTSEITIKTETLENYRADKIVDEQIMLERARKNNLLEGVGIHTRQINRLQLAGYEELLRWFVMDAAEKYV